MKKLIFFLALTAFGQGYVFNPFTNNLDKVGSSGSSTGAEPYTATVTAQTTLTVTAATHGQGTTPLPQPCLDGASSPRTGATCSFTVADNGDVVYTWSPAFTGKVVIGGGGAGATGPTGPTGPAGSNDSVANAQTGTNYTFLTGDQSKTITACNTGAQTYILPQAGGGFADGWFAVVQNICQGVVTIIPAVSTISGQSSLILQPGESVRIASNGTNYTATRLYNYAAAQGPSIPQDGLLAEYRFDDQNMFKYSQAFGQGSTFWSLTNVTINSNTIVAPDGTTTAEEIVETVTSGNHMFQTSSAQNGYSFAAGDVLTASIYVKQGTSPRQWAQIQIQDNGQIYKSVYDVSAGTVFSTTGGGQSVITPAGNGWYRISLTHRVNVTPTFYFHSCSTNTCATYAGSTSSSQYAWGAQVNYGGRPQQYLATTDLLTLLDSSPNANNAAVTAIGGSVPVRGQSGWVFASINSQRAQVPAGVASSFQTVLIMTDTDTILSTPANNASGPVIGSDTLAGPRLLVKSTVGTGSGVSAANTHNRLTWWYSASSPAYPNGQAAQVQSSMELGGVNMVGIVLDTALSSNGADTLYINGLPAVAYTASPASTGAVSRSGVNVQIGGSSIDSSYHNGTVYWVGFWNRRLSASEVRQAYAEVSRWLRVNRNIDVTVNNPATISRTTTTNNLLCLGDSITQGPSSLGYTTWCNATTGSGAESLTSLLTDTYTVRNLSISGNTMARIADSALNNRYQAYYSPSAKRNVAVLFAGTNDLTLCTNSRSTWESLPNTLTSTACVESVLSYARRAAKALKASGWDVIVMPAVSRTGSNASLTGTPTLDSLVQSYNAGIRGLYKLWSDGIADYCTNPTIRSTSPADYSICATGASANTTYFNADAVHPNNTGQDLIRPAVAAAVNGLGAQSIDTTNRISLTAQTASIATRPLSQLPPAGVYRITAYAQTTTEATSGSGCTLDVTVQWTDSVGATSYIPVATLTLDSASRRYGSTEITVASGDITYSTTRSAGTCSGDQYSLQMSVQRVW